MFLANVERLSTPKKGVSSKYRSPDDVVSVEKEPILFFSEIIGKDDKSKEIFVDVGIGIIEFDLPWDKRDSFEDYKIGDNVMVNGARNEMTNTSD